MSAATAQNTDDAAYKDVLKNAAASLVAPYEAIIHTKAAQLHSFELLMKKKDEIIKKALSEEDMRVIDAQGMAFKQMFDDAIEIQLSMVKKKNEEEQQQYAVDKHALFDEKERVNSCRKKIVNVLQTVLGNVRVFAVVKPEVKRIITKNPLQFDESAFFHFLNVNILSNTISGGIKQKLQPSNEHIARFKECEKHALYNKNLVFEAVIKNEKDKPMDKLFDVIRERSIGDLNIDGKHQMNSLLFAFGRTGAGKTVVMEGNGSTHGVYYTSVAKMLAQIPSTEYTLKCQVLEIYPLGDKKGFYKDLVHAAREKGGDEAQLGTGLLGSYKYCFDQRKLSKTPQKSKNKKTSTVIKTFKHELEQFDVDTADGFDAKLKTILKRRAAGGTKFNGDSSRSHVLVMLLLYHEDKFVSVHIMVDLAGYENFTEIKNATLSNEGRLITRSLNHLAEVIQQYNTGRKDFLKQAIQRSTSKSANNGEIDPRGAYALTQFLQPMLEKCYNGDPSIKNPPTRINVLYCIEPCVQDSLQDFENTLTLTSTCFDLMVRFVSQKTSNVFTAQEIQKMIQSEMTEAGIETDALLSSNDLINPLFLERNPQISHKDLLTKALEAEKVTEALYTSALLGDEAVVSRADILAQQRFNDEYEVMTQSATSLALVALKEKLIENITNPKAMLYPYSSEFHARHPDDANHKIPHADVLDYIKRNQTFFATPSTENLTRQEKDTLLVVVDNLLLDFVQLQYEQPDKYPMYKFFGMHNEDTYNNVLSHLYMNAVELIDKSKKISKIVLQVRPIITEKVAKIKQLDSDIFEAAVRTTNECLAKIKSLEAMMQKKPGLTKKIKEEFSPLMYQKNEKTILNALAYISSHFPDMDKIKDINLLQLSVDEDALLLERVMKRVYDENTQTVHLLDYLNTAEKEEKGQMKKTIQELKKKITLLTKEQETALTQSMLNRMNMNSLKTMTPRKIAEINNSIVHLETPETASHGRVGEGVGKEPESDHGGGGVGKDPETDPDPSKPGGASSPIGLKSSSSSSSFSSSSSSSSSSAHTDDTLRKQKKSTSSQNPDDKEHTSKKSVGGNTSRAKHSLTPGIIYTKKRRGKKKGGNTVSDDDDSDDDNDEYDYDDDCFFVVCSSFHAVLKQ